MLLHLVRDRLAPPNRPAISGDFGERTRRWSGPEDWDIARSAIGAVIAMAETLSVKSMRSGTWAGIGLPHQSVLDLAGTLVSGGPSLTLNHRERWVCEAIAVAPVTVAA